MTDARKLNELVNENITAIADKISEYLLIGDVEYMSEVEQEMERRLRELVTNYEEKPTEIPNLTEKILKDVIHHYLSTPKDVTMIDVDLFTDAVKKLRKLIGDKGYEIWRQSI